MVRVADPRCVELGERLRCTRSWMRSSHGEGIQPRSDRVKAQRKADFADVSKPSGIIRGLPIVSTGLSSGGRVFTNRSPGEPYSLSDRRQRRIRQPAVVVDLDAGESLLSSL